MCEAYSTSRRRTFPRRWAARKGRNLLSVEDVAAYPLPHGFLMWVPDDPQEHPTWGEGVPAVVLAIQIYARSLGCDWVRFDSDADTEPGLESWEW